MEFAVSGKTYRAVRPDARAQYRLLRRVAPVLPALSAIALSSDRSMFAATAALAQAEEGASRAAIDACLALAECRDEDGWRSASENAGTLPLSDTLRIVASVVAINFAPYFEVERPTFRPSTGRGLGFEPVRMPDDLDWLWRPMMRGLCRYESLVDGSLHIEDVATMNAILDAADENQQRAVKAAEREAGRGK